MFAKRAVRLQSLSRLSEMMAGKLRGSLPGAGTPAQLLFVFLFVSASLPRYIPGSLQFHPLSLDFQPSPLGGKLLFSLNDKVARKWLLHESIRKSDEKHQL